MKEAINKANNLQGSVEYEDRKKVLENYLRL